MSAILRGGGRGINSVCLLFFCIERWDVGVRREGIFICFPKEEFSEGFAMRLCVFCV